MKKIFDVNKIDLSKLGRGVRKYEGKWIAISEKNKIVSSGRTYQEALEDITNPERVILFKVPPMDAALAL